MYRGHITSSRTNSAFMEHQHLARPSANLTMIMKNDDTDESHSCAVRTLDSLEGALEVLLLNPMKRNGLNDDAQI